MTAEEIQEKAQRFGGRVEKTVDRLIKRLDNRAKRMQLRLLDMLLEEFVNELDAKDGILRKTLRNLTRVKRINKVLDKFYETFVVDEMKRTSLDLLRMWELSGDYFEQTGNPKGKVDTIRKKVGLIETFIGVQSGRLVNGGYLDRLAKTEEVRRKLVQYVQQSLVSEVSLQAFTTGLRALVVGSKDTEGALQQYYRQYAYDSFNRVHEVANDTFAEELGMKYFIYVGSLIKTSRRFCEKRAGKVFSIEEAKDWKNDPDLIDKKTKEAYNPLVELGRYNCRHTKKHISDEVAFALRPELKKAA